MIYQKDNSELLTKCDFHKMSRPFDKCIKHSGSILNVKSIVILINQLTKYTVEFKTTPPSRVKDQTFSIFSAPFQDSG